nr:trichohyalin-like [Nomia melanderi]XP_031850478.1 trichohyalin-like [Nomia melanderi]XP_031850479.1 trichohyalin-like [Nomia melanderi]XP_031850480.1 trichohyalin-like [Nomia melanderi]XP_031850482.1 trichohyalin-like [Nomia melanderi]
MEERSKNEKELTESTEVKDYIANFRRSSRNRESYDEIAELEAELRRAYIAKELRTQLIEKETERYIEKVQRQQAAKMMQLEEHAVVEDDLRLKFDNLRKSEDYRRQLTEQITRKQEEKCAMIEEARREREILTEVDRIRERREKLNEMEMKSEMAESLRRENFILQEMKVIRSQEEMETEMKKLLEDEEYLREIDRRAVKARKLHEEQMRNREQAIRKIAEILTNLNSQKEERLRLIDDIITADVKLELLIQEEEVVQRKTMRKQLAADLEEQIAFTEQCKLRFVEQDRAFAEEIMKKIMEDEKTEKLTREAKRRMQLQYRDDLARMIEKRRKAREDEIARMREQAKKENELEIINLSRAREKRKRLLETHASNVADFLDKNALTEEEKDIVEKAVESEFSSKCVRKSD